MTGGPGEFLWRRLDVPGVEHVIVEDRPGLAARGVAIAADPVPYTCTYRLATDDHWATARLELEAEGGGWWRQVRLERAAGRWRITAAERGSLDATLPGTEAPETLDSALDVDIAGSPLTNILPLRRLGLLDAAPGTSTTILAAWVLLPSLVVVADEQTYTVLGAGRVRYASGDFSAELDIDPSGYTRRYEGLAERVAPAP